MPHRGWRRGIRIIGRVAAAVALVLVVALGSVLIVLHTDWGRARLRDQLVDGMSNALTGELEIGALEGSVLGELVLRDIVIRDRAGREAIRIDRLELELALAALARRRIELAQASAVGVTIHAVRRDGRFNLAELARAREVDKQPPGWDLAIDDLELQDARIAIDLEGRLAHLDEVSAEGALSVPRDGALAGRFSITGTWRERDLPAHARAELRVADAVTELNATELAIGDLRVAGHGVRIAGGLAGQLAGKLTIEQLVIAAPAGALARVLPGIQTSPALTLGLTASSPAEGTTEVGITGSIAGAQLGGALVVSRDDPMRITGTLTTRDLDASRLVPGAIVTALAIRVSLEVTVDPARHGLAMLDGRIEAQGEGRVDAFVLEHAGLTVALSDGIAEITADARGAGGTRARLEATGAVHRDGTIEIAGAHVDASTREVSRVSPGQLGLTGALAIELTGAGTIGRTENNFEVTGRATGTDLRRGDLAIDDLRLTFDLAGSRDHPRGRAALSIRGARFGDQRVPPVTVAARSRRDGSFAVRVRSHGTLGASAAGPWSIDANTVVQLAGPGSSISLVHYRGRAGGIAIGGRGGTIEIEEQCVAARGVRAHFAGGTLELDGTYRFAGPGAGDLTSTLSARGLELAALDRAWSGSTVLRGRIDADLAARRRDGTITGSVSASVADLIAHAGADPVGGSLEATLSRSQLAFTARALGRRLGELEVSAALARPRHLGELAAWSRLERGDLTRVEVRARQLDLAAVASAAGLALPLDGSVDAKLSLGPARGEGWLRARQVITPAIPAPIDLDLALDLAGGGRLRVTARADAPMLRSAALDATVHLPARPFDLDAWTALGPAAVRALRVDLDDLVLDDRLATRLGMTAGWRGRASVRIDAAAGLTEATATIVGRELVGGPLVRPVDITATTTIDREGARAMVNASLGGAPLGVARLALTLDPRSVLNRGLAAIRDAPITGQVTIARTELAPIVAAIDQRRRGRRLRGVVRAEATVGGTIGAPEGAASLVLTDVGSARRVLLCELRVDARLVSGVATATVHGRGARGGTLAIATRLPLARPQDATTTVSASNLDLRSVLRLVPADLVGVTGRVHAEVRVAGVDPATATIAGNLRVRDGTLPLTDQLGVLHDATIELELRDQIARLAVRGELDSGTLAMRASATLEGLVPRTAAIDVTFDEVTMLTERAPRVSGRITAEVVRQAGAWKIDAQLTGGRVALRDKDARTLHPMGIPGNMVMVDDGRIPAAGAPSRRPGRALAAWPRGIAMTLRIHPVRVTAEQFRGQVGGQLEITTHGDGVAIYGTIDVVRGEVTLFDRRYRVDRAAVRFDGGIDPLLDIALVHDFPQLTLWLAVTGRLSEPDLGLWSEPGGHSEPELLAIVLGGAPGAAPGAGDRRTIDGVAEGAATAVVTQLIGEYIGRLLPIRLDVLRYEAATAARSGALTIGRRLTDRLYVSWRSRIDARPDENTGEALLEIWLLPRLLLEGVAGNQGVHGLDLLWARRW
ncbi:MAG: translocation/assembly module TamB domain-containing protein [Kofleriaceae bacterium]